jgi:hypothetical protein
VKGLPTRGQFFQAKEIKGLAVSVQEALSLMQAKTSSFRRKLVD